jgi:hypothetical protein
MLRLVCEATVNREVRHMRTLLVWLIALILVLVSNGVAFAVPPTGDEVPPEQVKQMPEPDFIRPVEGATSISGYVNDQYKTPMQGVKVKLFVDGLLVASVGTDAAGSYSLRYPVDVGKDKTVMLWYVAESPEWVPKAVVLHESRASHAAGLISRCIPRVVVKSFLEFNVQMVDVATRNKQLAQTACLGTPMQAVPSQ